MNKRLEAVARAIDERKKSAPEGTQFKTYIDSITDGTHAQTVLRHLYEEGSITSMEAFYRYSITRLSASIFELREAGVPIETIMRTSETGKRYGEYRLEEGSHV